MKYCPNCDDDITDSYQGQEVDVGIMSGGWWCEACGIFVEEEDDPFEEDMELDRGD